MIEFLSGFWYYIVIFLFVLTVVVFVHELGHFLVARLNGVRVETFSIGFGKEIWGWTSRAGTRWRISLLPLGGYVKMYGEGLPDGDEEGAEAISPEDKAVSFKHKSVGQRAAIVAAGPMANFVFGVIALAAMFMIWGQPRIDTTIHEVRPDSPAAEAGLRPGDRILAVNGQEVESFQDIQQIVRLAIGETLRISVARDGERVTVAATPRMMELTDPLGNTHMTPVLGVVADPEGVEIVRHNPATALVTAVRETGVMIGTTLKALGQMITGTRDAEELGGPIRIAQGAGQAAQLGLASVVFYMILISINLGLINLFPIPLLDGGHLAFYAVEAVRGRPLGPVAQEYGFRIGLFLVFALMIFATRNDLVELEVWEFLKGLTS